MAIEVEIEVEIYEKTRHPREHEDLSQRSIAKILGISRNIVKRSNGSHVPWEREGKSGHNRSVITDNVLGFIKTCLAEDETENIKSRSTR